MIYFGNRNSDKKKANHYTFINVKNIYYTYKDTELSAKLMIKII